MYVGDSVATYTARREGVGTTFVGRGQASEKRILVLFRQVKQDPAEERY